MSTDSADRPPPEYEVLLKDTAKGLQTINIRYTIISVSNPNRILWLFFNSIVFLYVAYHKMLLFAR